MQREFWNVLRHEGAEDAVRAIIVTGAGDRAFSAGADITEFPEIAASGKRDEVVRNAHAFMGRIEAHPKRLLTDLAGKINQGVFSNGHDNEAHQADVFDFLERVEGDVVFLDPPYGSTSSYEAAFRPLDAILAGRPVEATPSEFSGRRAVDALDRLLEACRHIPHLVLSYGNAAVDADVLRGLVERHRHDVHVETIAYTHLAGRASEESKSRNRELLVRAGRAR